MAGNNRIQVLRGTESAIAASTETLNVGQPLYDLSNSLLYIGSGGAVNSTYPVNSGGVINKKGPAEYKAVDRHVFEAVDIDAGSSRIIMVPHNDSGPVGITFQPAQPNSLTGQVEETRIEDSGNALKLIKEYTRVPASGYIAPQQLDATIKLDTGVLKTDQIHAIHLTAGHDVGHYVSSDVKSNLEVLGTNSDYPSEIRLSTTYDKGIVDAHGDPIGFVAGPELLIKNDVDGLNDPQLFDSAIVFRLPVRTLDHYQDAMDNSYAYCHNIRVDVFDPSSDSTSPTTVMSLAVENNATDLDDGYDSHNTAENYLFGRIAAPIEVDLEDDFILQSKMAGANTFTLKGGHSAGSWKNQIQLGHTNYMDFQAQVVHFKHPNITVSNNGWLYLNPTSTSSVQSQIYASGKGIKLGHASYDTTLTGTNLSVSTQACSINTTQGNIQVESARNLLLKAANSYIQIEQSGYTTMNLQSTLSVVADPVGEKGVIATAFKGLMLESAGGGDLTLRSTSSLRMTAYDAATLDADELQISAANVLNLTCGYDTGVFIDAETIEMSIYYADVERSTTYGLPSGSRKSYNRLSALRPTLFWMYDSTTKINIMTYSVAQITTTNELLFYLQNMGCSGVGSTNPTHWYPCSGALTSGGNCYTVTGVAADAANKSYFFIQYNSGSTILTKRVSTSTFTTTAGRGSRECNEGIAVEADSSD